MRSLYVKFVVFTIGIMIFSGILAFLISNTYYQQKLKPFNDQKNTTIALNIAEFTGNQPDLDLKDYFENISSIGYQIFLVDNSGNEFYFGAPFREKTLSHSTKEQVINGDIFHGILNFPQETFVTGFFANELKNTIGVPLTHNEKKYALFIRPDIKLLFNEMHILFGWLLALAIMLSIIMVIFITKYLVHPISKLTSATKSLSNGNYNVDLDITRHDELGELSHSFLRMASKLEQMDEMRKEFISNISHDIQSPLSNIKGYANLLKSESMSPEDKSNYISIINGEIKRLSTLTRQLLLLASLDRDEDIMKRKSVNIGKQIKELIRSNQWQIGEKGITLGFTLPDVEITGDPSLLNAVWDNLLTNAIKYNKPNGIIEISIKEQGKSVLVIFEDSGIGLNDKEKERIFDRFYRVDTARSRSVDGTGLGLSIVAAIVTLHGGIIHVNSIETQGTSFVVELPVR
ncbi:signal transduction histidine kinase [Solibacillus kalamii]|uniref:Heme sensor protein HssS n=1 Tax=Solibacillus kalamii TaxID=1748298 RepID=A0ABX3ZG91_9BACL|nr:HAMP domain-containing sensor histidine kinase [Solibacillus kalamii]MBM7665833.1 signal transduction histidine kinase [Solibacillus kalamii]OUZ38726.1 sensor histidine kinase [Solibacillus kalamii]